MTTPLVLAVFLSACGGESDSAKTVNLAGTWTKTDTMKECPSPSQQTIQFGGNKNGFITQQEILTGTMMETNYSKGKGFDCNIVKVTPKMQTIEVSEKLTQQGFLQYLDGQFNMEKQSIPPHIKLVYQASLPTFNDKEISYQIKMGFTNTQTDTENTITLISKMTR